MAENESQERSWWEAPWQFLVETITGICVFLVVAGAAIALSVFVHYLEEHKVEMAVIYGLKSAEYLLFGVDLVLFARFLWKTATRTWSKL